ncbi:hypothetical protein [Brevundimonas sp.]|uniref:hypothetical protein n=1 Tax=Brevundimonas sp. TaxID=1871086 RepID=UPI001A303AA3|nr:hypothetical protein [Brevundimonas sp.]MBJ7485659.1 hypothetical protein [Brevundimonas sp.]
MIVALFAAATMVQGSPTVVMPGVLDFPMLEGVQPAPDCLGLRETLAEDGEAFECLGAPLSRVNDLAFAYVRAASERGWTDAGGAGIALWMTRVLPDGKCQRLTIAGMWDFERTPRPRPNDPGIVVISLDPDIRCPVLRPAE